MLDMVRLAAVVAAFAHLVAALADFLGASD